MSVETPAFVDANVLVYAYDQTAGTKKAAAERLLAELWSMGTGRLSVQVLQEYFVTVTRKVPAPLSVDVAAERVRELAAWPVFAPAAHDVLAAIALHRQTGLSFWDAMVVHAAAESGCAVLWTEDLTHGQVIRGVCVQNPFVAPAIESGVPPAAGDAGA
jgi:predicted nucleic acid-binding protein